MTASQFSLPDRSDIAKVDVSPSPDARSRCLHVGAAGRRTIAVVVRPRDAASGRASGRLTFHLIGSTGKSLTTLVRVSFDMHPAPNPARAITLFVGLLIAGLCFPVALLLCLNWLGARFEAPQLLRFLARDVEIGPDGELSAPHSEPLDTSPALFEDVANEPIGGKRSFDLDNGRFRFATRVLGHRGERFPSLLLGPYGVVDTDSGMVMAGTTERPLRSFDRAGRAEVPLGLAGTWVFEPDPRQPGGPESPDGDVETDAEVTRRTVRGRLLLLVPSYAAFEGEGLVQSATERLRELTLRQPTDRSPRSRVGLLLHSFTTRLKMRFTEHGDDEESSSDIDEDELFKR